MTDKECLSSKLFTEEFIFKCLVTCEKVISKNAYLEKRWKNYYIVDDVTSGDNYKIERLKWMEYRKKLQSVLKPYYSMRDIISKSKSGKNGTTQTAVKQAVEIIESGDYQYDDSNFYLYQVSYGFILSLTEESPNKLGLISNNFYTITLASNYAKSCFLIENVSDLLVQKQNNKIKGHQI